jgi:hypothetical protein
VTAIQVRGLAELQSLLRNLAAEQLPYAMMTALNTLAFDVQKQQKDRLPGVFDRPTPLIKGAIRVQKATKKALTSVVYVEPKRAVILKTHEQGGKRGLKSFEQVLLKKGWLPNGYRVVPSKSFDLDSYGNPKPSEIKRIMSWAATAATLTGNRTKTQRYFCIRVGGHSKLKPGIWLQSRGAVAGGFKIRLITPLLLFVSQATYQKKFRFVETGEQKARADLPEIMREAVDRAIRTAR